MKKGPAISHQPSDRPIYDHNAHARSERMSMAGCHCSPSSAQQCSSPEYDDIGVGNLDCPEPAVAAGGRRPRTAHGESQRPLRFGAVADTQPPRLPDSRLATPHREVRDFAIFSIFDLAVWLAAFAAGATMPLAFRGAWWVFVLAIWLFLSALILRAADARAAHFNTLRRNLR